MFKGGVSVHMFLSTLVNNNNNNNDVNIILIILFKKM